MPLKCTKSRPAACAQSVNHSGAAALDAQVGAGVAAFASFCRCTEAEGSVDRPPCTLISAMTAAALRTVDDTGSSLIHPFPLCSTGVLSWFDNAENLVVFW